jgi:hypothetical protein
MDNETDYRINTQMQYSYLIIQIYYYSFTSELSLHFRQFPTFTFTIEALEC